MSCAHKLPPSMFEHLTSNERPVIYYYFWGIGAVCLIITFSLIAPKMRVFYMEALKMRDEKEKTLLPFSYITCLLILAFPLICSALKYITFISPITAYTVS